MINLLYSLVSCDCFLSPHSPSTWKVSIVFFLFLAKWTNYTIGIKKEAKRWKSEVEKHSMKWSGAYWYNYYYFEHALATSCMDYHLFLGFFGSFFVFFVFFLDSPRSTCFFSTYFWLYSFHFLLLSTIPCLFTSLRVTSLFHLSCHLPYFSCR